MAEDPNIDIRINIDFKPYLAATENLKMKLAIRKMIASAMMVKKAIQEPNPAIIDTVFVTEIGTAVDYLDGIIEDGRKALGEIN